MEMMSKPKLINFEATELRLGLPGGGGGAKEENIIKNNNNINGNGKRGFDVAMDLKLNLSSKETIMDPSEKMNNNNKEKEAITITCVNDSVKPPSKAQVVGWPPVRNFRKNIVAVQKSSSSKEVEGDKGGAAAAAIGGGAFVKVSIDGAPYLRKVDLKMYKSYQELSDALGKMFSLFTTGNNNEGKGMMDFMNEKKLMDVLNSSEYVPSYQDKDGDWMLVGDVPWEMFVDSCKRLRIMKGTEAAGLAPRAMEKYKNRS